MNFSSLTLELLVAGLALFVLIIDLYTPVDKKKRLGCITFAGLVAILVVSFTKLPMVPADMDTMIVQDALSIFFQRFFLVAALFVVWIAIRMSDRLTVGLGEFYVVSLMALSGMMLAASANDFALVFVALELISICFYILVSFQRSRMPSLEAGVKYLILSALSAAFLIFGIALIFGTSNETNFLRIAAASHSLDQNRVFWLGALLVLFGLSFKIAAFPLHVWAPDVYQGSPIPVTAFLAIGSKAAGFVLLLRVLFIALPKLALFWDKIIMVATGITILYGNLCAIPQRNLKRLLGYSSISNAGYLLLGIAAVNASGAAAVLYYLVGYLFALAAAFLIIAHVLPDDASIDKLAGLNRRSPFLAATLSLVMISLAGIPPLAGFLGKFLLLKALIERGATNPAAYWLALVAVVGVVISLYYYFAVIRVMYWSKEAVDLTPIPVPSCVRLPLLVCIIGMIYLGVAPSCLWTSAWHAVQVFKF